MRQRRHTIMNSVRGSWRLPVISMLQMIAVMTAPAANRADF